MKIKNGSVEKILPNLEGLIKIQHKEYLIPYVLPNDEVTFIVKRKQIVPIKIERKNQLSEIYQTPLCPYFGECGGCKGQHIKYEYQWIYKTQILKEKYEVLFPDLKIEKVLPETLYFYRNRMDFVVNQNNVGLRKKNSYSEIVDIKECKIQTQLANQVLEIFKNLLKKFEIGFDRNTNQGIIKYITIRSANQIGIILTIVKERKNTLYFNFINEFLSELKKNLVVFSLYECYSSLQSEVSNTQENFVIYGNKFLDFSFDDLRLKVPPEGFFQPNPKVIEIMMAKTAKFLSNQNNFINNQYHLVDLFCGVGVFSIYFYKRFPENIKSISGYELTKTSIYYAEKNANDNIPNKQKLAFINFKVLDLSKRFNIYLHNHTFLILDPPRSGLSKSVIDWILSNLKKIEWILYVSCNPAKQFLELEILKEFYDTVWILFGDPFPQTDHWESCILLRKK